MGVLCCALIASVLCKRRIGGHRRARARLTAAQGGGRVTVLGQSVPWTAHAMVFASVVPAETESKSRCARYARFSPYGVGQAPQRVQGL